MRDSTSARIRMPYDWIGNLMVVLSAVICIFSVILKNNQSIVAYPIQQIFAGEYSRDAETWYPLDDNADLDALDGDLFLRGHFSYDIGDGGRLYYYQDHIGVTVYLNGELLSIDTVSEFGDHGLALEPTICGSRWNYLFSPGITTDDRVEIRLHNPHSHGNSGAYREFLSTLYNSPDTSFMLESYLKPYNLPLQITGIVLVIAALMMLGAALASGLLRVPMGSTLWKYGLLSLFMGGFVILDTVGISFISELLVFNTYARQLCVMLLVYCVGLCVCDALTGRAQKTARASMFLSALLDSILIALSFTGVTVIYDTGFCWVVSQVVLCPLLIGCAAVELHKRRREKRGMLLACILLLSAVLLDIVGVGRSIYSHGTCTKAVFAFVFVLYAANAAKHVITDYQASLRAEKLEKELEESRVAITLSQIQPHFLYNSLTSISDLCRESPEAQRALNDFSTYLRGNMDSLTRTGPIHFSQELEHIKTYLRLEKLRFEEALHVEYDIQTNDFLLPPLTVQPIVENAVKHGVCQKKGGGTVTLRTRRNGDTITITVEDNGVGFDPAQPPQDGRTHVGIQNVRSRLHRMVHGELVIESAPGAGTKATITLREDGERSGGSL